MKKETLITILALFIIIVIFSGVSIFTLFDQSWRLDETQSLEQSIMPLNALIPFIGQDVALPSYLLILHFFLQIVGVNIFYTRLLSLFFLLLTIPVLYKLFAEASNKKIALLATILFSLSPFIYFYSSESRDYTLLLLVTTVNSLYFLRMIRSYGKKGKMGYFLSCLMGYYTHYFFMFFVFSQCLYVLWITGKRIFKDNEYKKVKLTSLIKKYKQLPFNYFTILIIDTLLFLPWIAYVAYLGFAANDQPLIPKPTSYDIFSTFANFLFGFQNQGVEGLLVSLWPLVVVGFFFIFTKRIRIPVENLTYFVFITFFPIFLVFMISYFVKPILLSRYLIFCIPTLFFIIAWTIMSYPKKIATFLIIGLSVVMIGLLFYQNLSNNISVKENYHSVDAYLNQHVQPGDIVVVYSAFTYYPVVYGFDGVTQLTTIPQWSPYQSGAIPAFTLKGLQQQMDGYQKVYENLYLVTSYDQNAQSTILHYMDTHFQREKLINYTPGLSLRIYRMRYD